VARVAPSWGELKTVLAAVGVSVTEDLARELKAEVKERVHTVTYCRS
jgi:hypothetical protein